MPKGSPEFQAKVAEMKAASAKVKELEKKVSEVEEQMKAAALEAKNLIDNIKPDVVIAADDDAQQYLVIPYLNQSPMPVVFCGINWDASVYDYRYETVRLGATVPVVTSVSPVAKFKS